MNIVWICDFIYFTDVSSKLQLKLMLSEHSLCFDKKTVYQITPVDMKL